jgi:arylsulfatase A-like enzyme
LVVSGPGIRRGRRTDALSYLPDLAPTICALAGVEAPFGSEGRDLGPLLRGESAATGRPEVFTAYRHVQRSVRDGRWKLIEYPVPGRTQLFDLKRDPAELVDLSDHAAHREQLRRLLGSLREQQRQLGDPLAGP